MEALEEGMNLRDHFAGLAMQGFVSDHEAMQTVCALSVDAEEEVAKFAYRVADAMIKESQKPLTD